LLLSELKLDHGFILGFFLRKLFLVFLHLAPQPRPLSINHFSGGSAWLINLEVFGELTRHFVDICIAVKLAQHLLYLPEV
jgi:hypothetical protein